MVAHLVLELPWVWFEAFVAPQEPSPHRVAPKNFIDVFSRLEFETEFQIYWPSRRLGPNNSAKRSVVGPFAVISSATGRSGSSRGCGADRHLRDLDGCRCRFSLPGCAKRWSRLLDAVGVWLGLARRGRPSFLRSQWGRGRGGHRLPLLGRSTCTSHLCGTRIARCRLRFEYPATAIRFFA